jgi:hypothetical protein
MCMADGWATASWNADLLRHCVHPAGTQAMLPCFHPVQAITLPHCGCWNVALLVFAVAMPRLRACAYTIFLALFVWSGHLAVKAQ